MYIGLLLDYGSEEGRTTPYATHKAAFARLAMHVGL
jgi:hypothetical protein